jgi:hypothetical protein
VNVFAESGNIMSSIEDSVSDYVDIIGKLDC